MLFRLALNIKKAELELVSSVQYNVTGWNITSKCLGRDISVRQHSKSERIELPATSRHRQIVESDVKPKSNKQTYKIHVREGERETELKKC